MMRLTEHYDDIFGDDEKYCVPRSRKRNEEKKRINLSGIYTSYCRHNDKLGGFRNKFE